MVFHLSIVCGERVRPKQLDWLLDLVLVRTFGAFFICLWKLLYTENLPSEMICVSSAFLIVAYSENIIWNLSWK